MYVFFIGYWWAYSSSNHFLLNDQDFPEENPILNCRHFVFVKVMQIIRYYLVLVSQISIYVHNYVIDDFVYFLGCDLHVAVYVIGFCEELSSYLSIFLFIHLNHILCLFQIIYCWVPICCFWNFSCLFRLELVRKVLPL